MIPTKCVVCGGEITTYFAHTTPYGEYHYECRDSLLEFVAHNRGRSALVLSRTIEYMKRLRARGSTIGPT